MNIAGRQITFFYQTDTSGDKNHQMRSRKAITLETLLSLQMKTNS